MNVDAAGPEFPEAEKERVWNRYWTYYSGSIIPAWLEAMAGEQVLWVYHERVFYRRAHCAWSDGWFYLGCAIEIEHRSAPAQSLRELRSLVAKVRHDDYDFTAAKLLDAQVTHLQMIRAREIRRKVDQWQAEVAQGTPHSHPSKMELIREIEAMKLPQGAAANLELMRTILGAETKAKNE